MTTNPAQHPIPLHAGRVHRSTRLALGRLVRRLWSDLDAAALIAHGAAPPPDHPARRRRLEQDDLARRLVARSPRP